MLPLGHCDPRIRNGSSFPAPLIARFVPSSFEDRGNMLLPCPEPHVNLLATYSDLLDWLNRTMTLRKWVFLVCFSTQFFLSVLFIDLIRIKVDLTYLFSQLQLVSSIPFSCYQLLPFDARPILFILALIVFKYFTYYIRPVSSFHLQWLLNPYHTRMQKPKNLGLNYPTQPLSYHLLLQNLCAPEVSPPIP
jgi:hypothetical protein